MPRALGHHYASSRNRRILRRRCITTSHVPCTTRRVARRLAIPGHLSLHEKGMLGEVQEIKVGEGGNLICACACPPSWRRSNVITHDGRLPPRIPLWGRGCLRARDHNDSVKNYQPDVPLTHLTFIFLVTISLVQQRVCRMIILLPLPFQLWFPLTFVLGCSNESVFETDDARAPPGARHGG